MAKKKTGKRIPTKNNPIYLEKLKGKGERTKKRGNKRLYPELRLKEKAANERMRQLEKVGIDSPAYQSIQARLEVLGRQTKGTRGRRFSETGRATYSEMQLLNKILDEFLSQKTSKLKGAKEYQEEVWNSANKNNKLAAAGITRDQWLKFWESMPDRKDRLYGSNQVVAIMRAYSIKNKKLSDDDKLSVEEIAEQIQASENLKDAYIKLGITPKQVIRATIKRKGKKKK